MGDSMPRQRALLAMVVGVGLACALCLSFADTQSAEAGGKVAPDAEPSKAGPGKSAQDTSQPGTPGGKAGKDAEAAGDKDAAKKDKSGALTVIVTGNGKPIQDAAVKVMLAQGVADQPERFTDREGEATLKLTVVGPAKVRVIAEGWTSVLQEVVLKEGPQRLTIQLKALSDANPPAGAK